MHDDNYEKGTTRWKGHLNVNAPKEIDARCDGGIYALNKEYFKKKKYYLADHTLQCGYGDIRCACRKM